MLAIVRVVVVVAGLVAPLHADILKVPQAFETIQLAVDDAQPGDTVLVSKGVYHETVEITTSGITLKGKSGAVIDAGYAGDCVGVVAEDVTVTGFTLQNGGIFQVIADGTPSGGLDVDGNGAQISKLVVRNCESFGIRIIGTGSVDKCVVDGCLGAGISIETNDATLDTVSEITRCTTTRCAVGISAEDGPFLIDKNDCNRCLSYGLIVGIPALMVDAPPPITGSQVTNNDCSNNFQYGLSVDIHAGVTRVEKNTVRDNGFGLRVGGFNLEVFSNTSENNTIYGMDVAASFSSIRKNKVRGNGLSGLLVGSASIVVDGDPEGSNEIAENTSQDNGGDGILLFSESNEILDNVVKDNRGDGVSVALGVLFNDIVGNSITGNSHDGIDNNGSSTLISENVCKDNGGADLAGKGLGGGTVDAASTSNVVGDGSGLSAEQELDMDTLSI